MMIAGLGIILIVVLAAPFLVKKIEEELEIFLLVMGCAAVTVTGLWSLHLVKEALSEPVKITLAVCVAGFLFKALQRPLARHVDVMVDGFGLKFFAFLVIAMLGILSSMLTAIIAALVLVEIVAALGLKRRDEVLLVVLACFSIGLGAALTPIGEPLSTIVIGKLKGEPYHAGFFFLAHHLWKYLIPGIIGFGIAGAAFMSEDRSPRDEAQPVREEPFRAIMLRTGKVYLFVVALVLLGAGFKPVIDAYISKLPYQALYWLNSISAVLDNATLAAAEIGPPMQLVQIKSALLGLLIAGGMLIPGNIPNIIAAGKLKIRSSEWAKIGVPVGLAVMAVYFFLLR